MTQEIAMQNLVSEPAGQDMYHLWTEPEFQNVSSKDDKNISFENISLAILENQPDVVSLVERWVRGNTAAVKETDASGQTALHLAASTNNAQVADVLLKAGADPNTIDTEINTVMHTLCSVVHKDVTEFAHLIIDKMTDIDLSNSEGYTALHLAASEGHLSVTKLLLDKEAKMDSRDLIRDTPVHRACSEGNLEIFSEFHKRKPDCVRLQGYHDETPLHHACHSGNFDLVKLMLEGEIKPDVNAMSETEETPLHRVCFTGSVPIAKLLLENGALIDPPQVNNQFKKSPFHLASFYARPELALFLLARGAVVSPKAFQTILDEGYIIIAKAVLETEQWPAVLRDTYTSQNKTTTAFRELISKMPALAELVLNKCTVPDPEHTLRDDMDFSVVYNYEFIEDTHGRTQVTPAHSTEDQTDGLRAKEKKQYGASYEEITSTRSDCHPSWGPETFDKSNHPFQIMVDEQHLNLLTHPVVGSLLHYKWQKFGLLVYIINLISYCVFLLFLTVFALVVPHPQIEQCSNNNYSFETGPSCPDTPPMLSNFLIVGAIIVLGLAFIRLLIEIFQFALRFRSYFKDFTNWLEVPLYSFSIVFVVVHANDCYCVLNWQWQVGVAAVFLGWIVLLLFLSKLPYLGIYVLIFVKILTSFFKMIILTAILILAFAIVFMMLFADETVLRSPFSDLGRSLVKTMTLTTGEFDFNNLFRIDSTGGADQLMEISYPPISYIMWVVFLILMPVVLMNMLTSLAVGDTDIVRQDAQLSKLALQVEQVLSTEEILHFLSKCLPWKLKLKLFRTILPNKPSTKWKRLSFLFWEGVKYDNIDVIKKLLNSDKDKEDELLENTHTMMTQIDKMKSSFHQFKADETQRTTELATRTTQLAGDVEEVKQTLNEVKNLLEEVLRRPT